MSKRVTVSLPDELGETLQSLAPGQRSARVAEALRRLDASDEVRALLRASGFPNFPADPAGAHHRAAAAAVTDDAYQAAVERIAALTGRTPQDIAAQISAPHGQVAA
jgi:hypothetical protein